MCVCVCVISFLQNMKCVCVLPPETSLHSLSLSRLSQQD